MGSPTLAAWRGKQLSALLMSNSQGEVDWLALRTGTAPFHPLGSWKPVVLILTWIRKEERSEDISMELSTHLNVRSLSPIKAKLAPSTVSTTSFPMVSGCLEAISLRLVPLPGGGGAHTLCPHPLIIPLCPARLRLLAGPPVPWQPSAVAGSLLSPAPSSRSPLRGGLTATSLFEFQGHFCSWVQDHLCLQDSKSPLRCGSRPLKGTDSKATTPC